MYRHSWEILSQYLLAKLIYLNELNCLNPRPSGRQSEASDAAKKINMC